MKYVIGRCMTEVYSRRSHHLTQAITLNKKIDFIYKLIYEYEIA